MQPGPLVSVIIPTYNRAEVLCRTIDNALAQTYTHTEIIVVDDGSTDETLSTLHRYNDRIRVIAQSNAGPAAARNRGIEAARGDLIAFQDSDDLWLPKKLERQVALLDRAGDAVVCCLCNAVFRYLGQAEFTSFKRSWLFPRLSQGIWTNAAEVLATRFVLFCQAVVIRRRILERMGGFDETLKYNEDYEFPLRLALEGSWAIIEEPLTIWQQGAQGSWSDKALHEYILLKKCEVQTRMKILEKLGQTDEHRRVRTLLLRELARNRRELWRAGLADTNIRGAASMAAILAAIDRCCWAIYRRSHLYPTLEMRDVPQELPNSRDAPPI